MSRAAVCPGCQRSYTYPLELEAVRTVGLALLGTCPSCGASVGLNLTWSCRARFTYQPLDPAADPAPADPAACQQSLL